MSNAIQQLQARLSIVVTDFDFHAMWLSRSFHRYFVAIDETKAHLEMLGIPSEYMVERLLNLNSDAQTVVVCGRNEELKQRILQLVDSRSSKFKILGYTNEMHKLMKIADIFIGKPGGITTSEAITCGLPMCVVSPIPGQEERNSDHLLEEGIAVKCNDLTILPFKLEKLLEDPDRLTRMKFNALRLAKPNASQPSSIPCSKTAFRRYHSPKINGRRLPWRLDRSEGVARMRCNGYGGRSHEITYSASCSYGLFAGGH